MERVFKHGWRAMNYWRYLWRVELVGLASLGVFALLVATVLVLERIIISPMEAGVSDAALLGFALTFLYGFVPVTLFGAPIYSALIVSGKFHWLIMLCVSVVPGIAIFLFHTGLGIIGIVGGACVFFLVHAVAGRRFLSKIQ